MTNDPRWEYKTLFEQNPEDIIRQVERWDLAGWELVSVVASDQGLTAFLKKQAPPRRRPAVNPIGLRRH